jgi:hypothetical protein
MVPQVRIEMESELNLTDDDEEDYGREVGGETTL